MVRRVTGPWSAAALPEIMAEALQESKRGGQGGGQTGEQQASNPEARSRSARRWSWETQPRPNVEVNRRAEGTSELNRRLGDGAKGAWALERCGVTGDYGWGCGGRQAKDAASTIPRWPSSRPATRKRSRSARRWSWETQPRPNVEVNRRAEGTSELNRRLAQ